MITKRVQTYSAAVLLLGDLEQVKTLVNDWAWQRVKEGKPGLFVTLEPISICWTGAMLPGVKVTICNDPMKPEAVNLIAAAAQYLAEELKSKTGRSEIVVMTPEVTAVVQ